MGRPTKPQAQLALDLTHSARSRKRALKHARNSRAARDGLVIAWRAVVLAVDTATRSGWAVRECERLLWSGECSTHDFAELDEVIALAQQRAQAQQLPLALVLERAWGGSLHVLPALGAARERWLIAWQRAGQTRSRVVSVWPATWRARVLAKGAHCARREVVREVELAAARAEVGSLHAADIGADEAAAILISRWAVRSPELAKALPKRVRDAAAATAKGMHACQRR